MDHFMAASTKPEERKQQTFKEELMWDVGAHIAVVVALSDGSIVTASYDDCLRHWDISTGECLRCIRNVYGIEGDDTIQTALTSIVEILPSSRFYQAGCRTAASSPSNPASNVSSSRRTNTTGEIKAPSLKVITGDQLSADIKLWNLSTGVCELVIEGDTFNVVFTLLLLQDGTIASAYERTYSFIKIWDIEEEEATSTYSSSDDDETESQSATTADDEMRIFPRYLRGHRGGIGGLVQLANGYIVSGGSCDCTIRIWDLTMDPRLYCCLRVLYCATNITSGIRVLGDGETIVCNGGRNGKLLFWDTSTGTAFPASGATAPVKIMEVLPDGLTVVTSDYRWKIMFWNYQHMMRSKPLST
jgi:WD40 repeat protein